MKDGKPSSDDADTVRAPGPAGHACPGISGQALSLLLPMHMVLSPDGTILGTGPTLAKVFPGLALPGQRFLALFEVRHPRGVVCLADLAAHFGRRLRLTPQGRPDEVLKAVAVPMDDGGLLLNLSFGPGVIDAVRRHALTVADFAGTDPTVQLLFMAEAEAAIMAELSGLTLRLLGARDAAEHRAQTDTLTGLRNRRAADDALDLLKDGARSFGLMHLDLDYFKSVNDTLGHAAGDAVLCAVAAILQANTRAEDVVARIGGDEFLMIFPDLADPDRLMAIANRIIAEVAQPIPYGDQVCQVAASIGVTLSSFHPADGPGGGAEAMLRAVDDALYAAKRAGRGQAVLAPPEGDRNP